MDNGFEALVGFVGSHSDAFELLELAEEVLDQVTLKWTRAAGPLDLGS